MKIRLEIKMISSMEVPDLVIKHTEGGIGGYKDEIQKAMQSHMMAKFGPTVIVTVLDDISED